MYPGAETIISLEGEGISKLGRSERHIGPIK
jgi:hypothetical protein